VSVFSKILRAGEGKKVRALQDIVPEINAMEPEIEALSDDALKHKTVEFREELARRIADGEEERDILNDFLVEAFAVVREAAKRVIGQRHFDVQLMGGAALHFGWIAEMKTGEGKTLVSTLPVYLNGLTGRGVHLVTVNDYLAKFHAEWMGRIYNWLGLSVGVVIPDVRHNVAAKQAAYACDITYGTNQEFGFDYLFDNLAKSKDHMRQRGHVFAIVDEVDSILIDEARTPLIISDRKVKIVDEFTGRILEGRRWSEGLHQAVEAKERVPIEQENVTQATVTLQNYFRMYEKLAGMTGTAETEASEFANTYELPVVPIPPNRPLARIDQPDLIYKTEQAKFDAVVGEIEERFERGQPVLVGTASVEKSEVLSRMLEKKGIPHNVLNAKQHAREAAIVAQAGRLHAVTVATNMAGRGVDILLGGNPEGLARDEIVAQGLDPASEEGQALYNRLLPKYESECAAEGEKVRELGGLYVLGSERHESRRIDNQLRGRAGRQGDPGESRFFLSLEDDLMRIFATGAMNYVMGKALPDDVPIESKMVTKAVQRAQTTVEARNAEIRKNVLKYDEVYNQQRKVIYARRMQVLDGEDLREETIGLIESALEDAVDTFCTSDYPEDWDLDGLLAEVTTYYPTKFTADELKEAATREQLTDSFVNEANAYYEAREIELGEELLRELERRIMLQIIDQHWVEHLSAMDYLNEGIGLRAMGQKDPLVEWQREGFAMFGEMMESIDADYVKYVMHVQVVVEEPAEPDLSKSQFTAAEDPVQSPSALPPMPSEDDGGGVPPQASAPEAPMTPIVKSEHEKVGRNDPCWCGSGKKFKHCHGQ
jgi:preprotein translocase subunit SecA